MKIVRWPSATVGAAGRRSVQLFRLGRHRNASSFLSRSSSFEEHGDNMWSIVHKAAQRLPSRVLKDSPLRSQYVRYLTSYSGTRHELNTGQSIPALGFGTWQDKDAQEDAVHDALLAGYRHIDTARIYGTERAVARGIKRSGIPREDIFLVTKLWNNSHHPDDVEAALDASLEDLNVDHVDLYLMHWPSAFKRGDKLRPTHEGKILTDDIDFVETWKAMEALMSKGKTTAIGISNFSKAEAERLLSEASIVPAVHQLECHPYLAQHSFADWHKSKGIHLTQYSPFGNQNPVYKKGQEMSKLIDDPVLSQIGRKYSKTGAQVALAWGIAKGRSVIPKSKTKSRVLANLQGDFKLDADDVEKIDGLDRKLRFNDPSESFGYQYYRDLDGKQFD
jgi:alcohol dehydrogenase (NADP+)